MNKEFAAFKDLITMAAPNIDFANDVEVKVEETEILVYVTIKTPDTMDRAEIMFCFEAGLTNIVFEEKPKLVFSLSEELYLDIRSFLDHMKKESMKDA